MKKISLKGKKLSERGKKAIVLTVMVALLVTVGVLNVNLDSFSKNDDTVVSTENSVTVFFDSHRASRTQARQEQISILDSIIASSSATAEAKQEAASKKLALCETIENELQLETLIKGKGFKEAAVVMSPEVLNILVTANNDTLSDGELAKIYDIVMTKTKYDLENVVVTPY